MAKPRQIQPNGLVMLEPVKCAVCDKLLGYLPVNAAAAIKQSYRAEPVAYCSQSCALQELQEEPAKLYQHRR